MLSVNQAKRLLEVFDVKDTPECANIQKHQLIVDVQTAKELQMCGITLDALKRSEFWTEPTAQDIGDHIIGRLDSVKLRQFVNIPREFVVYFTDAVKKAPGFVADFAASDIARDLGLTINDIPRLGRMAPEKGTFRVIDPRPEQLEGLIKHPSVKKVVEQVVCRAL